VNEALQQPGVIPRALPTISILSITNASNHDEIPILLASIHQSEHNRRSNSTSTISTAQLNNHDQIIHQIAKQTPATKFQ
jgi:hypothetical protein